MAVEWLTLGTAIAKLALRAYALATSDTVDWTTAADQIADAEGGLAGLRTWWRSRSTAQAATDLGKVLGQRIEAELVGEFGDAATADSLDDDVAAAATTAAAVMAGLMLADARGLADEVLITALAYPDRLYDYVREHGGDQRRRTDIPSGVAERVYDRSLRAACEELARIAPTAQQTVPGALSELLRRSDQIGSTLDQVSRDTSYIRVALDELGQAGPKERSCELRATLAAMPLPPYLAGEISELLDITPELFQLADVIASDPVPARTLGRWVDQPPPWLTSGLPQAWRVLGDALAAYKANEPAAAAYQAAVAAGATGADELEAMAALSLVDLTDRHRDVDALIPDNPHPLAAWIRAARLEQWIDAVAAAHQLPDASARRRESKAFMLAAALHRQGDASGAIDVLRQVAPTAEGSGIATELARILLFESIRGRRPSRSSGLLEALDWGLRARAARRRWHGDSVEPALIAFEASQQLGDRGQAHQIVTPLPEGTATPVEAADPRMTTAQAISAARGGDGLRARALAEHLDEFQRLRVDAELKTWPTVVETRTPTATERAVAVGHWQAVWDAATTDEERLLAARGLSLCGGTVDGLDDLRQREPDAMTDIDQLAESVPQPGETAKQRERRVGRMQHTSVYAAAELAWLQAEDGRIRQAAATLSRAADQFDDQRWRLEAATLLFRDGDHDAVRKTAEAAISRAGDRWPGQVQAHSLCVESAAATGDWPGLVAHGRSLLALTDEPEVRWALAQGLANLDDERAAWDLLHVADGGIRSAPRGAAHPRSTHLRLRLLNRFGTEQQLVTGAVEALRTYGDDEQLAAAIIGLVLTRDQRHPSNERRPADIKPPDPTNHEPDQIAELEEFRTLIEQFLTRFPDSQHFRAIHLGDPENPDDLRAALKPLLADRSAVLADVHGKVRRGELPFGCLAIASSRSYAEVHIMAAAEGHIIRLADTQTDQVELAAVAAAVDAGVPVFLDTTALHMLSYLTDQRRSDCADIVEELVITQAMYADLQHAARSLGQRNTTTVGWNSASNQATLTEIDPRIADAYAVKAQELVDLAREFAEVTQTRETHTTPAGAEAPDWLALIETCKITNHALWSDDAILRVVARTEGVTVFGTIAVLQHLQTTGQLTFAQHEEALIDLTAARAVDLPLTERRLRLVAGLQSWLPEAAAIAISRPAAWKNSAGICIAILLEGCHRQAHNPAALTGWFFVAGEGICALGLEPHDTANLITGFLAAILTLPRNTATATAALVKASRGLAERHQLSDPWPATIRETHRLLLDNYDEAACKMIILALITDLDTDDKTVAIQALLDPQRPRQESASM